MPIQPKQQPPYYKPESPYLKEYIAELTQTGTDAPTIIKIYKNTIGEIIWSRVAEGEYAGTLANAFTINNTIMPPFGQSTGQIIPLVGDETGSYQCATSGTAPNAVRIYTYADLTTAFTPKEWSTIDARILITIQVYNNA